MPIDFKNIKTTGNRAYDAAKIAELNDSLQYLSPRQRAYVLGTIIEESGGDPLAKSENGTYQGLIQWGEDRYRIQSNDRKAEFNRQLQELKRTLNDTTDNKSWTHGGVGSGYNSLKEAYEDFKNPNIPFEQGYRAFSFGYVRPKGKEDSYQNRVKVAKQVYDRIIEAETPTLPKLNNTHVEYPDATRVSRLEFQPKYPYTPKPMHPIQKNFWTEWGRMPYKAEGGQLNTAKAWDELSITDKSEIMKVAIQNGITTLPEIKQAYNQFAEGGNSNNIVTDKTERQWTIEDENNFNAWRKSLPENLRTETPNYDLRGAYQAGLQPTLENDGYYHLGSRDPQTGRILKAPTHPTYLEALMTDAALGYYPTIDNRGNTYTETWKGNKFAGGGHVYEVLPQMLKNAGLNVKVTSGYRKAGQAGKAGKKSWHTRHGAVDIVPQGKTTFSDIENVLYSNPEISQYMLANGLGLLDESGRSAESKATMRKTGATGAHFHIGKDTIPAKRYAQRMSSMQNVDIPQVPQMTEAPQQVPVPTFVPSNPQAFFNLGKNDNAGKPQPAIEEPVKELAVSSPYSTEALQQQERRDALNRFGMLMSMLNPNSQDNSLINTLGLLSGNYTI